MSICFRFALAATALLGAGGCARSAKVSSVHLDQPGTHVVSGPGVVSIAHSDGAKSRVCTRAVAPSAKGGKAGKHRGPAPARRAEPGGQLDVLLFRLCEARSNGDISAEQYAASVQTIIKTMESMADRPAHPPPMPRMQPGERRRPRFGPGRWGRPGGEEPTPPSEPEPTKKP